MAVISHGPAPEDHYSMVSNDLARDPDVSLQAKGLYLYLRSHREGWSMSTERIAEALGVHRNTVSKYVQELERSGFLVRDYSHSESGTFDGMKYVLLSQPLHKNTDNGVLPRAVFTGRGENVQHKKTNSFKKTKPLKEDQSSNQEIRTKFEQFWTAYPRKSDKGNAEKKFDEQVKAGAAADDLVRSAENYRAETERNETAKIYMPMPKTFLNQERWRDYLKAPAMSAADKRRESIKKLENLEL